MFLLVLLGATKSPECACLGSQQTERYCCAPGSMLTDSFSVRPRWRSSLQPFLRQSASSIGRAVQFPMSDDVSGGRFRMYLPRIQQRFQCHYCSISGSIGSLLRYPHRSQRDPTSQGTTTTILHIAKCCRVGMQPTRARLHHCHNCAIHFPAGTSRDREQHELLHCSLRHHCGHLGYSMDHRWAQELHRSQTRRHGATGRDKVRADPPHMSLFSTQILQSFAKSSAAWLRYMFHLCELKHIADGNLHSHDAEYAPAAPKSSHGDSHAHEKYT